MSTDFLASFQPSDNHNKKVIGYLGIQATNPIVIMKMMNYVYTKKKIGHTCAIVFISLYYKLEVDAFFVALNLFSIEDITEIKPVYAIQNLFIILKNHKFGWDTNMI